MLSNTSGLTRHSRVLKARTDVISKMTKMCPHLKKRKRCRAHEMENNLRISLTQNKEEEVRRKAMKLYKLQQEVMELEKEESTTSECTHHSDNNNDDDYGNRNIESIILELKQEPEYARWNLESAIEQEMIRLHMKRCPFSHQVETLQVLKKARKEHLLHEQTQKEVSSNNGKTSKFNDKQNIQVNEWHVNKVKVFRNLSAIQRFIACIMWQRSIALPRKVIVNVRKEMEERFRSSEHSRYTKEYKSSNINSKSNEEEEEEDEDKERIEEEEIYNDSVEEYLQSVEFKECVVNKENECVTLLTWQPEFGIVNLSFLPSIISYISSNMASTIIQPATALFFSGKDKSSGNNSTESTLESQNVRNTTIDNVNLYKMLQINPITEKQVDLSSPRVVEEVVTVVEWVMYLYNSYTTKILPWECSKQTNDNVSTSQCKKALTHKNIDKGSNIETMHVAENMVSESKDNTKCNLFNSKAPIVLRSLTLQSCAITSAEVLIDALRKHNLHHHLLALDLSNNKLYSLRFLFALRAYYGTRLLRLSLVGNAITAKPEYNEQVRRSLPRLTVLDGKPIRHALLKWWHPTAMSDSLLECEESLEKNDIDNNNKGKKLSQMKSDKNSEKENANGIQFPTNTLTNDEVAMVMDSLYRLTYIWEERRIPHTLREVQSFLESRADSKSVEKKKEEQKRSREFDCNVENEVDIELGKEDKQINENTSCDSDEEPLHLPEEEIWSEDNFPHRYLDEFVTFSFTIDPALHFFYPQTMILDKIAEMNNISTTTATKCKTHNKSSSPKSSKKKMILSTEDYTQLKTLDVSLRNASRELMHGGKAAISRAIRGAREVFAAYQLTLYGARMQIRHYLSSAVIAIHKLHYSANSTELTNDNKNKYKNKNENKIKEEQTPLYMVTLHGVMSLQLPSMLRDLFKPHEPTSSESEESELENNKSNSNNGNLTPMSVFCYYDRVLTFTHRTLPLVNRAWERHRGPAMVLCNDQLHLRPIPNSINDTGDNSNDKTILAENTESESAEVSCLYTHFSKARVTRLLIEFGLECCGEDGMALVQCVMERANSDASEHVALDVLVFGLKHIHESNFYTNNINNNNKEKKKNNGFNKTLNSISDRLETNNIGERDEASKKCHEALCKLLRHYIEHYTDKTHLLENKRRKHVSYTNTSKEKLYEEEEEYEQVRDDNIEDGKQDKEDKTNTFQRAFRIFSIINDVANIMNAINNGNDGDNDQMCNFKKWIQSRSLTNENRRTLEKASDTTNDATIHTNTKNVRDIDNKADVTLLNWSSTPHIITLTLLNAVVKLTNKYITHNFSK